MISCQSWFQLSLTAVELHESHLFAVAGSKTSQKMSFRWVIWIVKLFLMPWHMKHFKKIPLSPFFLKVFVSSFNLKNFIYTHFIKHHQKVGQRWPFFGSVAAGCLTDKHKMLAYHSLHLFNHIDPTFFWQFREQRCFSPEHDSHLKSR